MKNPVPYLFCLVSLLFQSDFLLAQRSCQLSGCITDDTGNVLPGVSIGIDNQGFGSITNANGCFVLSVKANSPLKLSFHLLGFADKELFFTPSHDTTIAVSMETNPALTQEILVLATRRGEQGKLSGKSIDKEELKRENLGQDLPYLLQLTPSAVVSSDAGAGIGYTGIRIRGTDASRINATIDGIPLNDAESQITYWVDLPDLAASTENIQVQRGAGSSTNGPSAFGASLNILSKELSATPFAEITNSAGSYHTLKNSISFGSGLLNKHFLFEGRYSQLSSDGFIDRGSSSLQSMHFSGAYQSQNWMLKATILSGHEVTYQCWNGVPESRFQHDEQGMQDFISRNYLDSADAANLLNSGITYNQFTYANQVDDYTQNHYQLHLSHRLNQQWLLNAAIHYTRGIGFYEEFKTDQDLLSYGLTPADSENLTSDIVRRKWLDNDFYGYTFSTQFQINRQSKILLGGAGNRYLGGHYGEVINSSTAVLSTLPSRYYDDDGNKSDLNFFAKYDFISSGKWQFNADLQWRSIHYAFMGLDDQASPINREESLQFINPKLAFAYYFNSQDHFSLSVSKASKEPGRDEYVNSGISSAPKAEYLYDLEMGFAHRDGRSLLAANGFFMYYDDQLVLTGEINDVGNYTRDNVKSSFRRGIELEASCKLDRHFTLDANATISESRIRTYTEFVDAYVSTDSSVAYAGQDAISYGNSPIAFSPALTGMIRLSFQYKEQLNMQLISRYVGEQFLDNTGSKDRMLNDFTIIDFQVNFFNKKILGKELRLNAKVNNLLNRKYAANGYTYGYTFDQYRINENFVYPQAGTNFLCQLAITF